MVMEDTESCNYSPVVSSMSSTHNWKHQCCKLQVFTEVFRRLKESGHAETDNPEFEDDLWNHFHRLPLRYALDVNVDRAEDVLRHKRLLSLANNPAKTPVFDVRLIQVSSVNDGKSDWLPPQSLRKDIEDSTCYIGRERKMYEVTVSTDDKPKLLSQLTALLGEVGLNIQEAHAFSTVDGYSLDVFVVDGWPLQETEQLRKALEYEIAEIQRGTLSKGQGIPLLNEQVKNDAEHILGPIKIPADKTDVWEIDLELLKFDSKVAAGTSGDLYRGDYCGQDVAIKVFKRELVNASMQREFSQEVSIMRKVRHKNVVKFIGACTKPPSLCIVTEFMLGGSVYDFLHKRRGIFKLPALLKVAIDVSKGMNYLHQNNIIHRDLKTANLLMDDNEVVKVADFGVARVICHSGVMTAETGTYRWMAPEVIEHKPYNHKADVFSFGIVLWELLTGKIPYEYLTPLQAAVGVVHKGLRPDTPQNAHPKLMELIKRCWHLDPSMRPEFSEIIVILQLIAEEIEENDAWNEDDTTVGGFLSAFWQTLTGGL